MATRQILNSSILLFRLDDGTDMMLTQDEYNQCLATMSKVVEGIGADFIDIGGDNNKKKGGHLMIRKRLTSVEDLLEIRVAVVGNVVIEEGRKQKAMG
jgi:hypothetical protein